MAGNVAFVSGTHDIDRFTHPSLKVLLTLQCLPLTGFFISNNTFDKHPIYTLFFWKLRFVHFSLRLHLQLCVLIIDRFMSN